MTIESTTLAEMIVAQMPHIPTRDQCLAVAVASNFLTDNEGEAMMLLTGYAGTGKTTLVGAMVKVLEQAGLPTVLLAPTGRAAKVMASYSDRHAATIHKEIYRQMSYQGPDTEFGQNFNRHRSTLFVVDEASMIGSERGASSGLSFGTGDLLHDLIEYVYSRPGCRLLLVGDTAQLPPVGLEKSPALDEGCLRSFDMTFYRANLTEVVRQDAGGVLWNATRLREMLRACNYSPHIRFTGFADIARVSGSELIESLRESHSRCGLDDTIVVTRSNKRAGIYNNGIRTTILEYEDMLTSGDRVVVVKNNYYWGGKSEEERAQDGDSEKGMTFIANGEGAVVRRFRNIRQVHGFTFADATLQFPDYDYEEVEATVICDTLQSDAPALTREQQESLFQHVWDDYPEFRQKRERMKAVRQDPLFNALQIKYGYAITCHKAQGGQWRHVYVDIGNMTDEMLTRDYVRWLYTALTRATEKVFLVNWPDAQTDESK